MTASLGRASRGSVSVLIAPVAKDVRAVQDVVVVRELINSKVPVERGGALRVSDATFTLVQEHLTSLGVVFALLVGIGSVPTVTAMFVELGTGTRAYLPRYLGRMWCTGRRAGWTADGRRR